MRLSRITALLVVAHGISTVAFGARPVTNEKKTLIIAIGDSLTAGAPFYKSPVENPPNGLGDREAPFTYWMTHQRPKWDVINLGVSGETSSQILARYEEALKLRPRYIVILAGVNDIFQGLPSEYIAKNLRFMYERAKSNSAMPVAVTVPPFNTATSEQTKELDSLNRWIINEAERQRIPIADVSAALTDPNAIHKLNGSPDGLHPDVGGYRTIGMKLIEAIDPIEKAWR